MTSSAVLRRFALAGARALPLPLNAYKGRGYGAGEL
jgi:hypothetical protein